MRSITAHLTALVFCLLLTSIASGADNPGIEKFKNFTPEQIKNLSNETLNKEVPMIYSFAAQRGLALDAKLTTTSDLNTLMYPAISDYDAAVKSFQSDLGEKPNGILTVWQIATLQERAAYQHVDRVGFPDNFSSYITDTFAHIEGTATMLDDKIAWPVNHVVVDCYKTAMYCEEQTIDLNFPDETRWEMTYVVLDEGKMSYRITRWENNEIDAIPTDNTACRTTTLNYNFKNKEFFETTRNADHECPEILGVKIEKLSKPRTTQLVDGKKIFEAAFSNIERKKYTYLSSEFRKRVDDTINQFEAANKTK